MRGRVATVAEHANLSIQVGGARSVQQPGSPVMGGVVRVFPGGEFPVFWGVRADAGGLEDEEFLGPVVLGVKHSEPNGFLETAAGDASDGLRMAQEGGEVPNWPSYVGVTEAANDVPDAIGKGADSTEANAGFFARGVVGASKGQASEVPELVQLIKDTSHGAIGGGGEVDAVSGKVSKGAADRARQDGRGDGESRHGVAEGVPGEGGGHLGAVQEVREVSSDRSNRAFDHRSDLETAHGIWCEATVVFSAWSDSERAQEKGLEARVGQMKSA